MSTNPVSNDPGLLGDLLNKQEALMNYAPHDLRPDSFIKMYAAMRAIDTLMRYLGSTGHKPWRPNPLSPVTQGQLLKELHERTTEIGYIHHTTLGADMDFSDSKHFQRQMVSGFGIIEESIEYLNSLKDGTRAEQLEELTDIMFFFLEQMLLNNFTWNDIMTEYDRKWKVNIKRYDDAKKNDFSWDNRNKERL